MKTTKATIVAGVIGYYLIAGAALVEFGTAPKPTVATAEKQSQAGYSELQKDEANLSCDTKRLRRDLRAGASAVAVAKDRNFVRQDLLNIQLDRIEPAVVSQDLARGQDLARLIGESFAAPVQAYLSRAGISHVKPRRA